MPPEAQHVLLRLPEGGAGTPYESESRESVRWAAKIQRAEPEALHAVVVNTFIVNAFSFKLNR